MESEDFEALAETVNTLKVQKLSLRFCTIDADQLDSLMGSLENKVNAHSVRNLSLALVYLFRISNVT